MRFSYAHKPVVMLTLFSLLASVLFAPAARAQDASPPSPDVLQVSAQVEGVLIRYDARQNGLEAASAGGQLPVVRYGGYQLPMQFITLAVPAGGEPRVEVRGLAATPLAAPPQPAAPELPPALGWEPDPNAAPDAPALPEEPIFIARQGSIRGQRYVVVAISPIYTAAGAPHLATGIEALVAGATPLNRDLLPLGGQAPASAPAVVVPVNRSALIDGYKLIVTKPGLQEIMYNDLGFSSAPPNLRLTFEGVELPVEKAGDRLRFYAPRVGDRWNAASAYWLTLAVGTPMAERAPAPPGPALGAYEHGEWRDNKVYKEGYGGADGDHWFHADLKASNIPLPGLDPAQTVTVPVQTLLPLRAGPSDFKIVATSYGFSAKACFDGNDPGYRMQVELMANGGVLDTKTATWKPYHLPCRNPIDKETSSTATVRATPQATTLLLRLMPNGVYNTGALLEAVTWRRPVDLDFKNIASGVEFSTDAGAGSLLLRNLPAAWRLYDITDGTAPQAVAIGSGSEYMLNQPADAPVSRYLLANLAGPNKPIVQNHAATKFGNVKSADAIYIGPAAFADELAPLLDLRRQQGFTPFFVDIQAIYDVYGFGQVSAVAIRNFLRQESDWQNTTRKISVVLAGDATMDPFAYAGVANDIVVAAWMDDVDPHQAGASSRYGEAACDACIAQLDGDDPVTGDNEEGGRNWFAADVWLGRLPARNETELAGMIAKLVPYDTNTDDADDWRLRKVFLADNYIKALDAQQNARPDEAGDFAALSDTVVTVLPNPSSVRRIYYDPAPDRQLAVSPQGAPIPASGGYYQTVPRTWPESWRISDIAGINTEVIATLSQGAALVAYNGHSNHFYFARTEHPSGDSSKDKWLLNAPEVSLLGNVGKEFVMLSMTCYTSQFVKPTANGTLDEWLIRHKDGGAIAVWGPTGLSVVSGHELLQQGFMRQLAAANTGEQRLGDLVEAGNTYLLTQNGPLDPLMTFVLLGDPLTMARIPTRDLYLPTIRR